MNQKINSMIKFYQINNKFIKIDSCKFYKIFQKKQLKMKILIN